IQLDFMPDVPATFVLGPDAKLLEIPTAPTTLERIQAAAQDLVRRLERIDLRTKSPRLQEAVNQLPATVANLNETITSLKALLGRVDNAQGPLLQSLRATSDKAGGALSQASVTLQSMQTLIAPNAPLAVDLATALRELALAAHSVRLLADTLDRNPSAV